MAEIIKDFIPEGKLNRPGYKLHPQFITIHDTANPDTGADALAHARYLKNNPDIIASWHFTVDDREIYQHLPLNENGWHAGDGATGTGNRQSIGIEICENKDGNRVQAENNAAWLTAKLLKDFNLSPEQIKRHFDWNEKNCPGVLRGRPEGWEGFLKAVKENLQSFDEDLNGEPDPEYPVEPEGTPIVGPLQVSLRRGQEWAHNRHAHQRFMVIAPVYWHYGELTGIRPEVLYAQSAMETAFGNFGGVVTPDQNNWAGIKVRNPLGDRKEDHESFSSPEEGVRGHFNHISAYVGLEPVGEPHGRYWLVKDLPWAGTIKYIEELGGKWAPSDSYGISIVNDFLEGMLNTVEPPEEPEKPEKPPWEPEKPSKLPGIIRAIRAWFKNLIERIKKS